MSWRPAGREPLGPQQEPPMDGQVERGEDLLIELIMPIISRVISKLERCQSHLDPRTASLHVVLSLADSMTVTIISEYFELHGNKAVLGTDSTTTLTKLFDQWVPLLQESAAGTTTSEYQLTQMFDHANTGAYVHRSAPQEPRYGAMYGADAPVRAVDRGLVARRLVASLLTWRAEQMLSAIGD